MLRRLRMVESAREIEKIRYACDIAERAFARVPQIADRGRTLAEVFRRFQILCLEEGADWVTGLGCQLTEWPSLIPEDRATLDAGMVLTFEPVVRLGSGRMLVHEEEIVVKESGAEFLSPLAANLVIL